MLLNVETSAIAGRASRAAARAADAAGVRVVDETEMDRLSDIADLLIAVWGTSRREAPFPAELLRGISHAGCSVVAAYDDNGALCGAAAAVVSPGGSSVYSLIAGVRPNLADAGVGFALKQHQRAWALTRGFDTMTWTFDPLVSRNARFNLTKLGAQASEYLPNFYGRMGDGINSNDESDRLLAVWPLASERTIECAEGRPEGIELPEFSADDVRLFGPDGYPTLVGVGGELWCRVPTDIVALRGQEPHQAAEWRARIREVFTAAFEAGYTADGVTRTGWYRLVQEAALIQVTESQGDQS